MSEDVEEEYKLDADDEAWLSLDDWNALIELAFDFWNNEEDAIYDKESFDA